MENEAPAIRFTGLMDALTFDMGAGVLTGPPLVGDKIRHLQTGRVFVVTSREWQAGLERRASMLIHLREEAPE